MKKINIDKIDFIGIILVIISLATLVVLINISLVTLEKTNLENENKRRMFEYELKEKRIKIENDSINLESLKKWNNMPSQYWEGRGEE
jgi:hypothetical protein